MQYEYYQDRKLRWPYATGVAACATAGAAQVGVVAFTPSALDATQVDGTYYYEVIMTDSASLTETVALDKYVYY